MVGVFGAVWAQGLGFTGQKRMIDLSEFVRMSRETGENMQMFHQGCVCSMSGLLALISPKESLILCSSSCSLCLALNY